MRIWTYKNADEKEHTFSRRSKNVKKRTKTFEKRILCKFTLKAGSHRSRQRQRYRSVAVTSNVKVFPQKRLAVTEVIFLISSVLR